MVVRGVVDLDRAGELEAHDTVHDGPQPLRDVVGVRAGDQRAGDDDPLDRRREQVEPDAADLEVVGVGVELRDRAAEHHVVEVGTVERRVPVHPALLQEVEQRIGGFGNRAHAGFEAGEPLAVHRAGDALLAAELRVDRLRRGTGHGRDAARRHAVDALGDQQLTGGVEEREANVDSGRGLAHSGHVPV